MQMVSPSICSTTDFLSQITSAMTVPFSMACSTTALSQQVAPWVLLFHGLLLFRSDASCRGCCLSQSRQMRYSYKLVNWAGGLHRAKKSEVSGFCYVNSHTNFGRASQYSDMRYGFQKLFRGLLKPFINLPQMIQKCR